MAHIGLITFFLGGGRTIILLYPTMMLYQKIHDTNFSKKKKNT